MIDRDQMRADLLDVLRDHVPHPPAYRVAELAGYGRHAVAPVLTELEQEGIYQRPPNAVPLHRLRPSDLDVPTVVLAERLGVTERTIRRYRARASTPPAERAP